ncbi:MAG: hypothetical protein LAO09_09345 [Acidobacteriia bacterium]|nr:hypothetical protein [Terriglobia bacterium]
MNLRMIKAPTLVAVIVVLTLFSDNARAGKVIHTFGGRDGCGPWGDLIADAAGNLYGTTLNGGGNPGQGVIFQLTPPVPPNTDWTENIVHRFAGKLDGAAPSGQLVVDGNGNLYGTTQAGGAFGLGTAWELAPQPGGGWTGTVLYSFFGVNGAQPVGGLVMDAGGNLYGTTLGGGANGGFGTVFELSPPPQPGLPWTETVLHSFTGGYDGNAPVGGVISDQTGNLYGTTQVGGAFNGGAVFQLSPPVAGGAWTLTVLHSFKAKPGVSAAPRASLTITAAGALIGTTSQGGPGQHGTVFGLRPPPVPGGPWGYQTLHSFQGFPDDGSDPESSLAVVGGRIYGTTMQGGAGAGTIFRLSRDAGPGMSLTETVLHSFSGGVDGSSPRAGMLFLDGSLYGTTSAGGNINCGTVFRLGN